MSLPVAGTERVPFVYDFPVYNFLQGAAYLGGADIVFAGKTLSFVCGAVTCVFVFLMLRRTAGELAAIVGALVFALAPVSVLMNTSAQPDAMAVALTVAGLSFLFKASGWWMATPTLLVTLAALIKFPIVVPFVPALAWALLVRDGRLVWPSVRSWIVIAVAGGLFVSWHLFRASEFPDLLQSRNQLIQMLLLGDLFRFGSASFYLKPGVSITLLMCSGAWSIVAILSILRKRPWGIVLFLGLVIYLVLVPTSAQQYYYLFAAMPLLALAVGSELAHWGEVAPKRGVLFLLCSSAIAIPFLYPYVLRQDRVIYDLASEVKNATHPDDLILVACNHDRVIGRGSFNPAFFFLAERRGWTTTLQDPQELIAEAKRRGAAWIAVTWYSPDLEVWWSGAMPSSIRNAPGVDMKVQIRSIASSHVIGLQTQNGMLFRP